MNQQADLLEQVIAELTKREGDLTAIAQALGLSPATVMRIRKRKHDPGYSKVVALHRHLFGESTTATACTAKG